MALTDTQLHETHGEYVGCDRLLEHGLSSVRQIAGMIHRKLPRHVPYDDLVNSGVIGLMDAIRKFDPNIHVPFACYAKLRIRGAIFDSLRAMDNASRGLRRKSRGIEQARHKLRSTRNSEPSDVEIAKEIGISLQHLRDLEREIETLEPSSGSSRKDNFDNRAAIESLPSPEKDNPLNVLLRNEIKELLMAAILLLRTTERKVVLLYYFHELSMKQIGAALGVGESRISQIHFRAIQHLRSSLVAPHRHSGSSRRPLAVATADDKPAAAFVTDAPTAKPVVDF